MERNETVRNKMTTIPEDLTEYARVHTGPGSWSAENFEASPEAPETRTPCAPFVSLWRDGEATWITTLGEDW